MASEDRERAEAYYFGFDLTGEPDIDGVLRAVARAGKASHHTSGWRDEDVMSGDGVFTPEQFIQAAAHESAYQVAALRAQVESLTAQLNDREAAGFQRAAADFVEKQEREALREGARKLEAERDGMAQALELARGRVAELEAELKRWRGGHALQAFQEDHEHELTTAYAARNAAEATVERVREAVRHGNARTRIHLQGGDRRMAMEVDLVVTAVANALDAVLPPKETT